MSKKRKYLHKRGDQNEIAEAVQQQQQRQKLRRQIATMKRLPKDFRDITLGTDWEAFADVTGRRKEMDAWWNGPVVYFGELNGSERSILGSPNELIKVEVCEAFDADNWIDVIRIAEEAKCSWIYLPDEESITIDALNVLFSRFGFGIRAKGQLISEHSGYPVGVVR